MGLIVNNRNNLDKMLGNFAKFKPDDDKKKKDSKKEKNKESKDKQKKNNK